MTYKEILAQVQRRVGHRGGYDNQLKEDYQRAVQFAETELMAEVKPSKKSVSVNIVSTKAQYSLKDDFQIIDFDEPAEIQLYSTDDVRLAMVETTYDEWTRWNPTSATADSENDQVGYPSASDLENLQDGYSFSNKTLISIHYNAGESGSDSGYMLSVKPAINGKVVLLYYPTQIDDIFDNLEESPRLPEQYHFFIIPGAVYYLAQVEAAQAIDEGVRRFYQSLQTTSFAEFMRKKAMLNEKTEVMSRAILAKPFMWYDDPRKYR